MTKTIIYSCVNGSETSNPLLKGAFDVRYQVFCIGQNVDPNYERDIQDLTAFHFTASEGDQVVGTLRFTKYEKGDNSYKLSRMAVLDSHQGLGIGKKLILFSEDFLYKNEQAKHFILDAQVDKFGFYTKLGYKEANNGKRWIQQNIEHVAMEKFLD